MKTIAFSPQVCYNLDVEATNYIAYSAALCYGSSNASFAYTLVASTPTAKHLRHFNYQGGVEMEYVYFIGNEDSIKIGLSKRPKDRVKEVQVGNPKPIKLLASIQCVDSFATEKWLHELFAQSHISGEWFNHTPRLDFVINFVKSSSRVPTEKNLKMALDAYDSIGFIADVEELASEANAFKICYFHLCNSMEMIDSYQLIQAMRFYKEWLNAVCCKAARPLKRVGLDQKPIVGVLTIVDDAGNLHECPNYFKSMAFIESKIPPIPVVRKSIHIQSELFKEAS